MKLTTKHVATQCMLLQQQQIVKTQQQLATYQAASKINYSIKIPKI